MRRTRKPGVNNLTMALQRDYRVFILNQRKTIGAAEHQDQANYRLCLNTVPVHSILESSRVIN